VIGRLLKRKALEDFHLRDEDQANPKKKTVSTEAAGMYNL
jgi:hypothetical protein